jgi:large subunit ribosomal protein L22
VYKAIKSAAANATNNFNLDGDLLYISEIQASDGKRMKRYLPRAKGSASPLVKRMGYLRLTVKERR